MSIVDVSQNCCGQGAFCMNIDSEAHFLRQLVPSAFNTISNFSINGSDFFLRRVFGVCFRELRFVGDKGKWLPAVKRCRSAITCFRTRATATSRRHLNRRSRIFTVMEHSEVPSEVNRTEFCAAEDATWWPSVFEPNNYL